MKRRFLSLLLATLMLCSLLPAAALAAGDPNRGYEGQELPRGPDTTGDVWVVTPETAQYTLDGAYGSIDGKTICLARATIMTSSSWAGPPSMRGAILFAII